MKLPAKQKLAAFNSKLPDLKGDMHEWREWDGTKGRSNPSKSIRPSSCGSGYRPKELKIGTQTFVQPCS